jgi:hypothetical protein
MVVGGWIYAGVVVVGPWEPCMRVEVKITINGMRYELKTHPDMCMVFWGYEHQLSGVLTRKRHAKLGSMQIILRK